MTPRRSSGCSPAQSALGHALYVHYGLHPQDYETNILIADGIAWFKSEAGIRILEDLGRPWSLVGGLRILPRPVRDQLYDFIARNRLRVFGSPQRATPPTRATATASWTVAAKFP